MNIYERIFDRLEELHMSQIELSRRTGIATSTISDWRKKKINPQADKLVAICKALDMPLVDLLCDEDDKKNKVLTSECVTDDGLMIETIMNASDDIKRRVIAYYYLICDKDNSDKQGWSYIDRRFIDSDFLVRGYIIMVVKYKGQKLRYVKDFHGKEVLWILNPEQIEMPGMIFVGGYSNEYCIFMDTLSDDEQKEIRKQLN